MTDEAKQGQRSTASGHHRPSVAEEPVTSVLAPNEVPVFDRELSADEEVLAALGYKYVHQIPITSPTSSARESVTAHDVVCRSGQGSQAICYHDCARVN